MPFVLLVIVLLVFLAMAVQSGMQSYATAKQAEAQIATAHVAQINAWGNLIIILVLLLGILALFAFIVWMLKRNSKPARTGIRPRVGADEQPQLSISDIKDLATLKVLMSLLPKEDQNTTEITKQSEEIPNLFHWLK